MMKYVIVFCLAMLPAEAFALCLSVGLKNVSATQTYSSGAGGYGVYQAAESMQTVTFGVEVLIAALSCNYYVVLSPGGSGNVNQRVMTRAADGATLPYNAYATLAKTAIIKDHPAASGDRINGSFGLVAVGASNNHSFYWTIPAGQVVKAGAAYFQDSVTISLYQ